METRVRREGPRRRGRERARIDTNEKLRRYGQQTGGRQCEEGTRVREQANCHFCLFLIPNWIRHIEDNEFAWRWAERQATRSSDEDSWPSVGQRSR